MVNRRCAAVGEKAKREERAERELRTVCGAEPSAADGEKEAIVSPGLSVFEQDARFHFRAIGRTLLSPSNIQSLRGYSGLIYAEVALLHKATYMTFDEILDMQFFL